jgi:hypothetical protein
MARSSLAYKLTSLRSAVVVGEPADQVCRDRDFRPIRDRARHERREILSMKKPVICALCVGLLLVAIARLAHAGPPRDANETDHNKASADAVAKELSNPAGSLASLSNNLEYTDYKGDLPNADDQDGWSYSFQPVLPFPVGNKGRRIIFRPLIPVKLDEPVFKPAKLDFDDEGPDIGDVTFDLVYAGTEMTDPKAKKGYLWGLGAAGTLPTATDDDFAGDQVRLGPELFGGIIREWGIVGGLLSHQWQIGGSKRDDNFSASVFQYIYAYGLGNGWQIAASPVITVNWKADGGEAWSVPLGVGLAKTTVLGKHPVKFQFQIQKYVVQPDAFGPDWLAKLTITPVIHNPFTR